MASLVEWVIDELDADLAMRRRELIDLRLLVASSSGSHNLMLSRACQVMAYAHWEGFVKKALEIYLDHLVRIRLRVDQLRFELQALFFEPQILSCGVVGRAGGPAAKLLMEFDARATAVFRVDPSKVVRSGNMTSNTLRVLLQSAALDYLPAYDVRSNYIDSVICGRRHRIAHGAFEQVSPDEARQVAEDVLALCDELNLQVQTAALYREYLR